MTDPAAYHSYDGSVRQFDLPGQAGGVVRLNLYGMGQWIPQALPPDLPPLGERRDLLLRKTLYVEGLWASAVSIAITKMASLAWDVESTAPRLGQRAQDLLLHADGGAGWVQFLSKHLRAFYCNNKGAFIEVARASRVYGSRVVGIHHLPSSRCEPTNDPDIPIIYRSLDGREHEMRWWQVLRLTDMPSDEDDPLGGICAAQRAYDSILKLAAIERYVLEKVTGARPLEIHVVSGLNPRQVEDALTTGQEAQVRRGHTNYMGVVILPVVQGDAPISGYRIPVAELPEGFDYVEQFRHVALRYADTLGIDPQDIQPLTGQALGTGAQSVVLDRKAAGKGSASWQQDLSHKLNELVMADPVRFYFSERDVRDLVAKAQADKARLDVVTGAIESGMIDAVQGLQVLVDEGIMPKEFLTVDQTETETIGDGDKPEAEPEQEDGTPAAEAEEIREDSETKAARMLDAETAAALELVRQVLRG